MLAIEQRLCVLKCLSSIAAFCFIIRHRRLIAVARKHVRRATGERPDTVAIRARRPCRSHICVCLPLLCQQWRQSPIARVRCCCGRSIGGSAGAGSCAACGMRRLLQRARLHRALRLHLPHRDARQCFWLALLPECPSAGGQPPAASALAPRRRWCRRRWQAPLQTRLCQVSTAAGQLCQGGGHRARRCGRPHPQHCLSHALYLPRLLRSHLLP